VIVIPFSVGGKRGALRPDRYRIQGQLDFNGEEKNYPPWPCVKRASQIQLASTIPVRLNKEQKEGELQDYVHGKRKTNLKKAREGFRISP